MGLFDSFGSLIDPFDLGHGNLVDDLWGGLTGKTGADAARDGANAANAAALLFSNRQEEANANGLARAYQMMYGNDWASKLAPGLNPRQLEMMGLNKDGSPVDPATGGSGGGFGDGLLSQYGGLVDQSRQNYGQLGQQWQQAMNANNPLATASRYAGNRENQIREDSERDLKSRNAMTRAALAGSGFTGSTTLANQMAGNADDVSRRRDRSITDLGMASTDRMMAAQNSNRNAALQGVGMQERGMGQQMGFQQAPLGLQSQLAFAAMNPGQVRSPSAGLSPQGSYGAYMGNHWGNMIGLGAGIGSMFI